MFYLLLLTLSCILRDFIDCFFVLFFFQAEDGIRDAQESRGLGDVYKRQSLGPAGFPAAAGAVFLGGVVCRVLAVAKPVAAMLSLIHI